MKCEKCGKEFNWLKVREFEPEGTDFERCTFVEEDEDIVFFDTTAAWTGANLDKEDQIDTISCPHCGEFPFKSEDIEVIPIVRVVMRRNPLPR